MVAFKTGSNTTQLTGKTSSPIGRKKKAQRESIILNDIRSYFIKKDTVEESISDNTTEVVNTNVDHHEIDTFRSGINYYCKEKKMNVSSDESIGIEGGFRPRRFKRRAQRELAVLAIRNQLSEQDFWDLPGEEKTFEAARQRHELLTRIDALKNIEDTEHEDFETSLKEVFHETSAVLKLLQEEVFSNWAKGKIKYSEGELIAIIEEYLSCNSHHLDDFLSGWRLDIFEMVGGSQALREHWKVLRLLSIQQEPNARVL